MSANEIITELEKLPVQDRQQVLDFLLHKRPAEQPVSDVRYADDAEFDRAVDKVLTERADLFRRLAQ